MAMKKLSEEEWNEMYDRIFAEEIHKFRHTEQKLFGNEDVSEELRYRVGDIVRNMYRVKLNINKEDGFILTDRHGIQFFVAEYYKGKLSIGVMNGGKTVCGHVLVMADYTKDGLTTHKLLSIIQKYSDLFKASMDAANAIDRITELAGKKNIV